MRRQHTLSDEKSKITAPALPLMLLHFNGNIRPNTNRFRSFLKDINNCDDNCHTCRFGKKGAFRYTNASLKALCFYKLE